MHQEWIHQLYITIAVLYLNPTSIYAEAYYMNCTEQSNTAAAAAVLVVYDIPVYRKCSSCCVVSYYYCFVDWKK
jgi:hypothetical protein